MRPCCLLLFAGGAAAVSLRGYEKGARVEQHIQRKLPPKLCVAEWTDCKANAICNNCLEKGDIPEKPTLKGPTATCDTVDKWWAQIALDDVPGCAKWDEGKTLLSLLLYCRYDSYAAEAKLKCDVADGSAAPSAAPSMVPTTMPFVFAPEDETPPPKLPVGPVGKPAVTAAPETAAPVTDAPVTDAPAATDPPATDPPATEPPATEAGTQPPAVGTEAPAGVEGACGFCGVGCGCVDGVDGCQCGPEFPGYVPPEGETQAPAGPEGETEAPAGPEGETEAPAGPEPYDVDGDGDLDYDNNGDGIIDAADVDGGDGGGEEGEPMETGAPVEPADTGAPAGPEPYDVDGDGNLDYDNNGDGIIDGADVPPAAEGGDGGGGEGGDDAGGEDGGRVPTLRALVAALRAGLARVDSSNLRAGVFRAVRYLLAGAAEVAVLVDTGFDLCVVRGLERDQHQRRRRQQLCSQMPATPPPCLSTAAKAVYAHVAVQRLPVLVDAGFDLCVVRGLERDQHELWERMQSLKLVKRIMEVSPALVPTGVVRSVAAVAGHKEDNFRRVCLETLRALQLTPLPLPLRSCCHRRRRRCRVRRELSVRSPEAVARVNGFRCLFGAILDPATQDLVDPLLSAITFLLEDPSTRQFIRPGVELQQLLSGFTDTDWPAGLERHQRWQAARGAVVALMRTWSGIILLAADPRGLVTLVQLLSDSAAWASDAPQQCSSLGAGCARASGDDGGGCGSALQDAILETLMDVMTPEAIFKLAYKYFECGLVEALTALAVTACCDPLRRKATALLLEVLRLAVSLLSARQCAALLSLLSASLHAPSSIVKLPTESHSAAQPSLHRPARARLLIHQVLRLAVSLLSARQCAALLSMPKLVALAAGTGVCPPDGGDPLLSSCTGSEREMAWMGALTAAPAYSFDAGPAAAGGSSPAALHVARKHAARAADLVRVLHVCLGSQAGAPGGGPSSETYPHTQDIGGLALGAHESAWEGDGEGPSCEGEDHLQRLRSSPDPLAFSEMLLTALLRRQIQVSGSRARQLQLQGGVTYTTRPGLASKRQAQRSATHFASLLRARCATTADRIKCVRARCTTTADRIECASVPAAAKLKGALVSKERQGKRRRRRRSAAASGSGADSSGDSAAVAPPLLPLPPPPPLAFPLLGGEGAFKRGGGGPRCAGSLHGQVCHPLLGILLSRRRCHPAPHGAAAAVSPPAPPLQHWQRRWPAALSPPPPPLPASAAAAPLAAPPGQPLRQQCIAPLLLLPSAPPPIAPVLPGALCAPQPQRHAWRQRRCCLRPLQLRSQCRLGGSLCSVDDPKVRRQLRVSMGSGADRSLLEAQINRSKVLATKDFTKWDWEVIEDALRDSLPHAPRLSDALRTKWVKRLSGYFRFLGHSGASPGGLHEQRWDARESPRVLRCGARLYAALLRHAEGRAFLAADRRGAIFQETSKVLAQAASQDMQSLIIGLRCGARLHAALLRHAEGHAFLVADWRGALFQETSKELEALLLSRRAARDGGSGGGDGGASKGGSGGGGRVFDLEGVQRRMTAGYIALLMGVAARDEHGREVLRQARLFAVLRQMGGIPELDFVTRLVVAHLDPGRLCLEERELLMEWLNIGSPSLCLYIVHLARAVLDAPHAEEDPAGATPTPTSTPHGGDVPDNERWALHTLLSLAGAISTSAQQLPTTHGAAAPEGRSGGEGGQGGRAGGHGGEVRAAAVAALIEAAADARHLRAMVDARRVSVPQLQGRQDCGALLMRFLSIPEGAALLCGGNDLWAANMAMEWHRSGCGAFAASAAAALHRHLCAAAADGGGAGGGAPLTSEYSIPSSVHTPVSPQPQAAASSPATLRSSPPSVGGVPIPVKLDQLPGGGAVWGGRGLQLLMRLPWNMEVVLSRDGAPSGLQLKLDTFVKAGAEAMSDDGLRPRLGTSRTVRIRGEIVDSQGKPTCHPVESHLTLHVRMCVGASAVDRYGRLQPPPPLGPGTPLAYQSHLTLHVRICVGASAVDRYGRLQPAPPQQGAGASSAYQSHLTLHVRMCFRASAVDRYGHLQPPPPQGAGAASAYQQEAPPSTATGLPPTYRQSWRPSAASHNPHINAQPGTPRSPAGSYHAPYQTSWGHPYGGRGKLYSWADGGGDDSPGGSGSESDQHLYWSSCRPHQRQPPPAARPLRDTSTTPRSRSGSVNFSPALNPAAPHDAEGEYPIVIPSETAVFVFETLSRAESGDGAPSPRGRGGGGDPPRVAFLKAVEFTLSLECGGRPQGRRVVAGQHRSVGNHSTASSHSYRTPHATLLNHSLGGIVVRVRAADARRAAAWSLASIAQSQRGLRLLLDVRPDFVSDMVAVATGDPNLAVRGAALMALPLVAATPQGRELLQTQGWEASRDQSLGIFLPSDLGALFQAPSWRFAASPADPAAITAREDPMVTPGLTEEGRGILVQIARLSNHITSKDARTKLARLRKGRGWKDVSAEISENNPALFLAAHALLRCYAFPLPMRRFVHEMFDDIVPKLS
ncbi:hypothetical protein JKP88DRAFT_260898 [Tribonema minus]|uniref:HECT-type E3 ubiquitin transferase n=1 Tax=Tribonema minus TaxID=303371 RepID=A0A836CPS2_9STRA|nr:hypothetical protein JKP88DRAFT_260898 [Tribonema minus]